jgi:hypothetical protein
MKIIPDFPSLAELPLPEATAAALTAYVGDPKTTFHGVALVVSSDDRLRTDILYALLNMYLSAMGGARIYASERELVHTIKAPGDFYSASFEEGGKLEGPEPDPEKGKVIQGIRKGGNYAQDLRMYFRSDPDYILVGDLDDLESRELAFQFGITGMRAIAGVRGDSIEDAARVIQSVPFAANTVDLVLVAKTAQDATMHASDEIRTLAAQ